jgi:hypothetical protein
LEEIPASKLCQLYIVEEVNIGTHLCFTLVVMGMLVDVSMIIVFVLVQQAVVPSPMVGVVLK